jgi:hypothetical protein
VHKVRGQTLVKPWSNPGQTLVKPWSNPGQTPVKRWSKVLAGRSEWLGGCGFGDARGVFEANDVSEDVLAGLEEADLVRMRAGQTPVKRRSNAGQTLVYGLARYSG